MAFWILAFNPLFTKTSSGGKMSQSDWTKVRTNLEMTLLRSNASGNFGTTLQRPRNIRSDIYFQVVLRSITQTTFPIYTLEYSYFKAAKMEDILHPDARSNIPIIQTNDFLRLRRMVLFLEAKLFTPMGPQTEG